MNNISILQLIEMQYPGADAVTINPNKVTTFEQLKITLPDRIKYSIEKKGCYKNAVKVAEYLTAKGYDCKYVEGYTTYRQEIPIEHAFIKIIIDGTDFYLDPTMQYAINQTLIELQDERYFSIKEYTMDEVRDCILKYKQYGPWCIFDKSLRIPKMPVNVYPLS